MFLCLIHCKYYWSYVQGYYWRYIKSVCMTSLMQWLKDDFQWMIKVAASLTFVALCDVVVAVSCDYIYYKELQQCAKMGGSDCEVTDSFCDKKHTHLKCQRLLSAICCWVPEAVECSRDVHADVRFIDACDWGQISNAFSQLRENNTIAQQMGLLAVSMSLFSAPVQTLPVAATMPEAVLLSDVGFSADSLAADHVFVNWCASSCSVVQFPQ